jgi:hypothetical protein
MQYAGIKHSNDRRQGFDLFEGDFFFAERKTTHYCKLIYGFIFKRL